MFAGGHLREPWTEGEPTVTTVGRIVVCEPPHVMAFTWADRGWSKHLGKLAALLNG
jgi:hypothetical protein